ncbi:hypothetical protein, partial [Streptomyces acidiscabies]|uniref:hypothetical protein n=1 Tax=Streptomyces acidiscabies TaxID=42234 RepID=UPI0005945B2D
MDQESAPGVHRARWAVRRAARGERYDWTIARAARLTGAAGPPGAPGGIRSAACAKQDSATPREPSRQAST